MSQQWETAITDRLVKFFSTEKESVGKRKDEQDLTVTASDPLLQALHNISSKLPLDTRIRNIPEFCQFIQNRELDSRCLWKCWTMTEDLLQQENKVECHKSAYLVMCAIAKSHFDDMEEDLRCEFFRIIQTYQRVESILLVKVLSLLTREGRDIVPFQDTVWSLIFHWLVRDDSTRIELLGVIINIIKHNSALIEESILVTLIKIVCSISNESSNATTIELSLKVLDALVRYGQIPNTSLSILISSLCRTVNIEAFNTVCWSILSNLLTGTIGYQGIRTLCKIIDDKRNYSTVNLLRGAVFFLSMAVWGSRRVSYLHVSPVSVLPSLLRSLSSRHYIIAFEVSLAIKRLVTKFQIHLDAEWVMICQILSTLRLYVSLSTTHGNAMNHVLKEIMDFIEGLYRDNRYTLPPEVFKVLELYSHVRSPKHSFFLLDMRKEEFVPMSGDWIESINAMMKHYFILEKRTEALDTTQAIFKDHNAYFGSPIAEHLVLTYLQQVHRDADEIIQHKGIAFIIYVAKCVKGKVFFSVVDVLVRAIADNNANADIRRVAIAGIISIFHEIFTFPQTDKTLYLFHIFLQFVADRDSMVRRAVLGQILQLRSNKHYVVQLQDQDCCFLHCGPTSQSPLVRFPMPELFQALTESLKREDVQELFIATILGISGFLTNRWIMGNVKDTSDLVSFLTVQLQNQTLGHANTQEQRWENKELGYQLLTQLLVYVPTTSLSDITQCFCACLASAAVAKDKIPAAYHSVLNTCLCGLALCSFYYTGMKSHQSHILNCLHSIIGNSPDLTKTLYILEYLHFQATCFPSLVKEEGYVQREDHHLVFDIILKFVDRKKNSLSVVAFAYRVLYLWVLLSSVHSRLAHFRVIEMALKEQMKTSNCLLAEAALDLVSRLTFTDCAPINNEMEEESLFFSSNDTTSTWIHGNTLLTIMAGKLGWVKVKVRRATGSVVWFMQLQNKLLEVKKEEKNASKHTRSEKRKVKDRRHLVEADTIKQALKEVSLYFSTSDDGDPSLSTDTESDTVSPYTRFLPATWEKEEEIIIPMSSLYPPLPSYEDEIPSYLGGDPLVGKLSQEAQLYLHSCTERQSKSADASGSVSPHLLWNDHVQAIPELNVRLTVTKENEPAFVVPRTFIEQTDPSKPLIKAISITTSPSSTPEASTPLSTPSPTPVTTPRGKSLWTNMGTQNGRGPSISDRDDSPTTPRGTRKPAVPTFGTSPGERRTSQPPVRAKTASPPPLKQQNPELGHKQKDGSPRKAHGHSGGEYSLVPPPPSPTTAQYRRPDFGHPSPTAPSRSAQTTSPPHPRSSAPYNINPYSNEGSFFHRPLNMPSLMLNPSYFEEPQPQTPPSHPQRHHSDMSPRRQPESSKSTAKTPSDEQLIKASPLGDQSRRGASSTYRHSYDSVSLHITPPKTGPSSKVSPLDEFSSPVPSTPVSLANVNGQSRYSPTASPSPSKAHMQRTEHEPQPDKTLRRSHGEGSIHRDELVGLIRASSMPSVALPGYNSDGTSNSRKLRTSGTVIKSHKVQTSQDRAPPKDAQPIRQSPRMATPDTQQSSDSPSLSPSDSYASSSISYSRSRSISPLSTNHPIKTRTTRSRSIPDYIYSGAHKARHTDLVRNLRQSDSQPDIPSLQVPIVEPRALEFRRFTLPKELPRRRHLKRSKSTTQIRVRPHQVSQKQEPRRSKHRQQEQRRERPRQQKPLERANDQLRPCRSASFSYSPREDFTPDEFEEIRRGIAARKEKLKSKEERQQHQSQQGSLAASALQQYHPQLLSIHPSFVFLQLQHLVFSENQAQYLEPSEALDRAINLLDQTLAVETIKIGILYIGEGQTTAEQILENTWGSSAYMELLYNLGDVLRLAESSPDTYTGGLDRSPQALDGQWTIGWKDDFMQIVFHVATLMPNREGDPQFTNKKLHIGNDYVHIVYNDSNQAYALDTLSGQFNFVAIVIVPVDHDLFSVSVQRKQGVPSFGPVRSGSQFVKAENLAKFVRTIAIHANSASQQLDEQDNRLQCVSNCEERLRQFKQIRDRFLGKGTTPTFHASK